MKYVVWQWCGLLDVMMNDKIAAEIATSISNEIGHTPEIISIKCDICSTVDCDIAIEKAVFIFTK